MKKTVYTTPFAEINLVDLEDVIATSALVKDAGDGDVINWLQF